MSFWSFVLKTNEHVCSPLTRRRVTVPGVSSAAFLCTWTRLSDRSRGTHVLTQPEVLVPSLATAGHTSVARPPLPETPAPSPGPWDVVTEPPPPPQGHFILSIEHLGR